MKSKNYHIIHAFNIKQNLIIIRCAEQLDTIGKLKRDKGLAEELLLNAQSNSLSYVNFLKD